MRKFLFLEVLEINIIDNIVSRLYILAKNAAQLELKLIFFLYDLSRNVLYKLIYRGLFYIPIFFYTIDYTMDTSKGLN